MVGAKKVFSSFFPKNLVGIRQPGIPRKAEVPTLAPLHSSPVALGPPEGSPCQSLIL